MKGEGEKEALKSPSCSRSVPLEIVSRTLHYIPAFEEEPLFFALGLIDYLRGLLIFGGHCDGYTLEVLVEAES